MKKHTEGIEKVEEEEKPIITPSDIILFTYGDLPEKRFKETGKYLIEVSKKNKGKFINTLEGNVFMNRSRNYNPFWYYGIKQPDPTVDVINALAIFKDYFKNDGDDILNEMLEIHKKIELQNDFSPLLNCLCGLDKNMMFFLGYQEIVRQKIVDIFDFEFGFSSKFDVNEKLNSVKDVNDIRSLVLTLIDNAFTLISSMK